MKTVFNKLIIFLMIFALVIPQNIVFAGKSNDSEAENILTESEQEIQVKKFPKKPKKGEKTEIKLRKTKNKREFLNEDGSITAEFYGQPINYKAENGVLLPIDNKIVENIDKKFKFKNKSNSYSSFFSEDDATLKISSEELFVEITPQKTKKEKGKITENKITYSNIYPHINIEYLVRSEHVKEDVILKNKNAQNEFTYSIETNGLTPRLNEDNTIDFINKENEIVFKTDAPFAYDENLITTDNIKQSLNKKENTWVLTTTLDEKWLKDKERAFPVVLDPTITHQPGFATTKDVFAYEAGPTTSYYNLSYVRTGNNGYGKSRTYIDFPLSALYSGAKISNAYIELYQGTSVSSTDPIDVHEVTKSWSSSSVTWNVQPTYNATPVSSQTLTTSGWQKFNVTNLVNSWYNGDKAHYGFMIKNKNEDSIKRDYSSSETSDPTKSPKLVITYKVDDIGSESFWSFDNGVNLINGNYVMGSTDVGLTGRGIPISFGRTYNSQDKNQRILGYGWSSSAGMQLKYKDDPKISGVVSLIDDDGTKHVFVYENNKWIAPPGINLELIYDATTKKFMVKDKSQVRYQFNTEGELEFIEDENKNKTIFSYNTDKTLASIKDASGRIVSFAYTNGKLQKISGNEIQTVEYAYDVNNNLKNVKIIGNQGVLTQVTYEYDNNHNLIKVIANDGHSTSINYNTDNTVKNFIQSVTENGTIKNTTISYAYSFNTDGSTIVTKTNPKGIKTQYTINSVGNLEKVIEAFGLPEEISSTYEWDQNNLLSKVTDPKGQSVVYTYGTNDNVESAENPKGFKTLMKYDLKNNVTQVTGFAGETVRNYYDTSSNKTGQTSASSDFQLSEYDDFGNVTKSSSEMNLADNRLMNSGFEKWTNNLPNNWQIFKDGGDIIKSTIKKNGSYGVGLDSYNGYKMQLISDYIPVVENTTYNLNWDVKTDDVKAADVIVRWYSSTSNFIKEERGGIARGGLSDWIRKMNQFESPENAIYARIMIETDQGLAYFDNIQFEEGYYINEYSYAANGGFESDSDKDGVPNSWYKSAAITSSDGMNKTQFYEGKSSLLINGVTGADKYFGQKVDLSGKAGNKIKISGWTKTDGINTSGGNIYVRAIVYHTDGTEKTYNAIVSKTNHDWQYVQGDIIAEKDYSYLRFYAMAINQTGKIWFDHLTLRTTGNNNALSSNYNISGNSSFEYFDTSGNYQDWYKNISNGGSITTEKTNMDNVFVGYQSIRIKDTTGWALLLNNQLEPLKPNTSYTFSAMVKGQNLTSGAGFLKFQLHDINGTHIGNLDSSLVTKSGDWKRIAVTISEKQAKQMNANAHSIKVAIGTKANTVGEVYFDAVRFEEASIITSYTYDTNKNYVTSITDIDGSKTSYTIDKRGNMTKVNFPKTGSYAEFEYDELDRITANQDASGLRTEIKYNLSGNATDVLYKNKDTGNLLGSTKQEFNEFGEITKFIDQNRKETKYEKDLNGNVTGIIYPTTNKTNYTYNSLDELKKVTYNNETTTWDFNYDKNGNLTKTLKNGLTYVDQTIDPQLDQVTKITYPSVNGVRNNISLNYDPSSRLTSYKHSLDPTSVIHTYYVSGLAHETRGAYGETSKIIYDEGNKVTKLYEFDGNNGYNTYFEYNDMGMLERMRQEDSLLGEDLYLDDKLTYDANGNIVEIKHFFGTKDVYSYDVTNQLINEKKLNSLGVVISQTNYTYDVFGNRLTQTKNGVTTNYTYEATGSNQLMSVNGISYTYDTLGSLTSDGEKTYIYDAENQLKEVKNGGTTIATYEYDYDGNRTKKVSSGKTENYYYVADELTHITDENNKLLYSFTRTEGGRLLSFVDHTGTSPKKYYYVLSHRGDVIGLRDINGDLVVEYTYDAFGNIEQVIGNQALANVQPFRYASYFFDKETNLYQLGERYYNPKIGRFIQRDNIPNNNLYVYTGNNPITFTDGNGNILETAVDVISIGISANDFRKKPNLKNGLFLAWDVGAAILPFVPGSYTYKAMKYVKTNKGANLTKKISNSTKSTKTNNYCSFTESTTVQTPHGDITIEKIKIGDYVLAKSDETGELAYKKVIELFPHTKDEIYELHIESEIIQTTEEHPFWVEEKQDWIPVRNLKVGDLLTNKDGKQVTIHDIIVKEGETKVFNFEVEDFHTYFVGENDVWTHNQCGSTPNKTNGKQYSVVYQTKTPVTGSRAKDRTNANKNLLQDMQNSPGLNSYMNEITGSNAMMRMESGKSALKNPSSVMDWHHDANNPGMMQLIYRPHHKEKGEIQSVLHPNGLGGFGIFGRKN